MFSGSVTRRAPTILSERQPDGGTDLGMLFPAKSFDLGGNAIPSTTIQKGGHRRRQATKCNLAAVRNIAAILPEEIGNLRVITVGRSRFLEIVNGLA